MEEENKITTRFKANDVRKLSSGIKHLPVNMFLRCLCGSQGAAAATPPPRTQPADSCRELAMFHPVVHSTTEAVMLSPGFWRGWVERHVTCSTYTTLNIEKHVFSDRQLDSRYRQMNAKPGLLCCKGHLLIPHPCQTLFDEWIFSKAFLFTQ